MTDPKPGRHLSSTRVPEGLTPPRPAESEMALAESQASSRIFISYRREDSIAHVNALVHPLRARFGQDRLFKDTDSIAPGQDFLNAIQRELESCSVFLAVIGSEWLTVQKPKSNIRRLDDPTDYLRVEVATALRNEKMRVSPYSSVRRACLRQKTFRPTSPSSLVGMGSNCVTHGGIRMSRS